MLRYKESECSQVKESMFFCLVGLEMACYHSTTVAAPQQHQ